MAVVLIGLFGVGFGGFVLVIVPARAADLGVSAAREVAAAQNSTNQVDRSVTSLWNGITPSGSMALSSAKVTANLALSQTVEKGADDASAHIQTSEGVLLQAQSLPFQLRAPGFIATDQATLGHLDKALQAARRLAFAASLQLAIAQHSQQDQASVTGTLKPALDARNWALVARTAGTLEDDLKAQENLALNPEALLDPLWGKWLDALAAYVYTAQQYALAESAGQIATAQSWKRTLDRQDAQAASAWTAAQANNAAWQHATLQPQLDGLQKELAAGGAS